MIRRPGTHLFGLATKAMQGCSGSAEDKDSLLSVSLVMEHTGGCSRAVVVGAAWLQGMNSVATVDGRGRLGILHCSNSSGGSGNSSSSGSNSGGSSSGSTTSTSTSSSHGGMADGPHLSEGLLKLVSAEIAAGLPVSMASGTARAEPQRSPFHQAPGQGVLVVAAGQQAVVLTYILPMGQQEAPHRHITGAPTGSSGGACVVTQPEGVPGAVQRVLGHEVLRQASRNQGRQRLLPC